MPQHRHILFLNEFYHPDICASAVVAADHLPKIAALRPDWKVSIICGDRAWDDPSVTYPAREVIDGVSVVRVDRPAVSRSNLFRRALGFAAFGRNAIRAARSLGGIDIVVGTTAPPQGGDIARKIAKACGCPYVYKVLDLYPDLAAALGKSRANGFIHRRWLTADTKAMQQAAAVVCIAERMTRRIAQTRPVTGDMLHTIHDGYDPMRLATTMGNSFQGQHDPNGRFVVQYAGNMGLSHPFDAILAAAKQLAADDRIRFQFIGDGPQREAIRQGLSPNSELIPYQPAHQLGSMLASADVCLISQHDAMFDMALPYKIYAILAAGRPVIFIGNRRSEIVDWLESSGAGICVSHADPAALVGSIQALRNNNEKRAASGRAARSLFEARFDSNAAARAWVELLGRC